MKTIFMRFPFHSVIVVICTRIQTDGIEIYKDERVPVVSPPACGCCCPKPEKLLG